MRMMKTIRFGAFAAAALAISLVIGCSNPIAQQSGAASNSGKVLVQIAHEGIPLANVQTAGARTLIPNGVGLYYTLVFTDTTTLNPQEDAVLFGAASTTVALDAGTWDLAVEGYLSQADAEATSPAVTPVVTGSATGIVVSAAETTPVTVDLTAALSPGEWGTLNYAVKWPYSGINTVTKAELTVEKVGGGTPITVDLMVSGTINTYDNYWDSEVGTTLYRAVGSIDLESGYYNVGVTLYNGGNIVDGDIAHIYNDLETAAVFTYTAAHFAEAANTTALTNALTAADTAKTGVLVSAAGEGIPVGVDWVTQAALNTLNSAITAAQSTAAIALSQVDVDAAETDLTSAISTFTSAKTAGTYDPAADATLGLYVGSSPTPEANTETLAQALAWLQAYALDTTDYTILLGADESLPPWTLGGAFSGPTTAADGKTGVTLTLKGYGTERTVQLSAGGSLFTVDSGVTLVLDANIRLNGRTPNTAALVTVNDSALELNAGAKISGNINNSSFGGGVYVSNTFGNTASFTMSGGEISGNTGYYGGGVFVYSYDSSYPSTFTMSGGEITGNTAIDDGGGVYFTNSYGTLTMSGTAAISGNTASDEGGGVNFNSYYGTFTMSDSAAISGNTANYGGGVYFNTSYGTLIMSDSAAISGNTATYYGGGVLFSADTLTMSDSAVISGNTTSYTTYSSSYGGGGVILYSGTLTLGDSAAISGNTSNSNGGGVHLSSSGTLTLGGTAAISDNTATYYGGGVYVNNTSAVFTMSGGAISGNTTTNTGTSYGGGGVYVSTGTFTKTGGVIKGDTDTRHRPGENTAKNDNGHALNIAGTAMRNAEIGNTDNVDVYNYGGGATYSPILTDPFWDKH
ncbi:hypothetical protein AGMMS4952_02540 [Spirochaetia bacterium]|nr:hypothetical protein AGMMS4952_02540 [Spirochaetia bacterium]